MRRTTLAAALAVAALAPGTRAQPLPEDPYTAALEHGRAAAKAVGPEALAAYEKLDEAGVLAEVLMRHEEVLLRGLETEPYEGEGVGEMMEELPPEMRELNELLGPRYAPKGYLFFEECSEEAPACKAYFAAFVDEGPDATGFRRVEVELMDEAGGEDATNFDCLLVNPDTREVREDACG